MKMILGAILGVVPGLLIGMILLFSDENPPDFQPSVYDFNLVWFFVITISGVAIAGAVAFAKRHEGSGFMLPLILSFMAGLMYPPVVWFVYVTGVLVILLPLWIIWQNLATVAIVALLSVTGWLLIKAR